MDSSLEEQLKLHDNGSSKKKYIYLILILITLAGAYYYFILNGQTKEENIVYKTKAIKKGDIQVTVMATGNLEPTNSVDVGIEVSGTIKEIYVDFNDMVKEGQVLAKLDTSKLQTKVDSSRASLTISKANLKESQVNVQSKKLAYNRTLKMYKQSNGKYPSKNELDDAKFSYDSALASYEASKAKVNQAQFNLNTDENNLEKAVVKSSINGIVLNRAVEVGQTVAASMSTPTLFTVAKDLSKMDLIVNIDEADVADIKKDLDVSFTVDAYPNETFKGKIKQVRYNPIEMSGVITYETVVLVDNKKQLLRPGMTANATIYTKEEKDKFLIPNAAFRFKPKADEKKDQTASVKNLVAPKKRTRPKRKTKELGKSKKKIQRKAIWYLKDGVPEKIRVAILVSNDKFTAVQSKKLSEGLEVITSQSSTND